LVELTLRNSGYLSQEAGRFAKAARWLAVIKRDYPDDFERIAAKEL
jgi:hypothetical protein